MNPGPKIPWMAHINPLIHSIQKIAFSANLVSTAGNLLLAALVTESIEPRLFLSQVSFFLNSYMYFLSLFLFCKAQAGIGLSN
jgi:hypothetical protein